MLGQERRRLNLILFTLKSCSYDDGERDPRNEQKIVGSTSNPKKGRKRVEKFFLLLLLFGWKRESKRAAAAAAAAAAASGIRVTPKPIRPKETAVAARVFRSISVPL